MPSESETLAQIDLEGVTPTCLWHTYSSGTVERERLAAWRDAFHHPRWNPQTRWRVEPDEAGRNVLAVQYADAFLVTGERTWQDYTVTAGVRPYFPFNINPSVNLGYRQDCLNGLAVRIRDVRSYYLYCLENLDRLTLYRVEDDELTALAREWVAVDRTRCQTLTIDCRGQTLSCWLDGRPMFTVCDTAHAAGPVGLRANSKVAFDAVRVTADAAAQAANAQRQMAAAAALKARQGAYPQPAVERRIAFPLGRAGALQLRRVEADDAWGFYWLVPPSSDHDAGQVAACSMAGSVLWSTGLEPARQGSLTPKAYDVNQDGHDDLLVASGAGVKVLDGQDGSVLADIPFPASGPLMGVPGETAPISYCYAPQFRPPPAPRDIILMDADPGGGLNVWCYELSGALRWHTLLPFRYGHNMYFADVDGDGCEEAMLGHCLVRGDGSIIWAVEEMRYEPLGAMGIHSDSVVMGDLAGDGALRLAAVAGDDGVLFVDGQSGKLLNRVRIGHAQGISAARYAPDTPGLQVLAGTRHRAYGIFVLFDGHGRPLHRWQPDYVNQGGHPVNWRGDGEELLMLFSEDSGHGLFDARGRLVVPFAGPLAGTRTVVAQPVGDDPRDRLVAVTAEEIVICGPEGAPAAVDGRVYAPRRQYWRGGTLGVISHQGWV